MAHEYNLTEARRKLRTDNKTLQRWLQDAEIDPAEDKKNTSHKLITHAQLEHLAQLHGRTLPPDTPAKSADPLAALERRVKSLEAKLTDALARIDALEHPTISNALQRSPEPQQTALPAQQPSRAVQSFPKPPSDTVKPETFALWHFADEEERQEALQRAQPHINERHMTTGLGKNARSRLVDVWQGLPGFRRCGREGCACGD